jgi:hypothetical protein
MSDDWDADYLGKQVDALTTERDLLRSALIKMHAEVVWNRRCKLCTRFWLSCDDKENHAPGCPVLDALALLEAKEGGR